jgi:hypothetical protein
MIYTKQIEQIARVYSAKLALKPKKEWTADELEKLMRQYAEDVAKIVRDATLRFYESKEKQEPVPADLVDLPLFRPLPPPYIPQPLTGTPPPIRSVMGSP